LGFQPLKELTDPADVEVDRASRQRFAFHAAVFQQSDRLVKLFRRNRNQNPGLSFVEQGSDYRSVRII